MFETSHASKERVTSTRPLVGKEGRIGQDGKRDKQHGHVVEVQHASVHIVAHRDVPNSGSGMSKGLVWEELRTGFHYIPAGKEERMPGAKTELNQRAVALWAVQLLGRRVRKVLIPWIRSRNRNRCCLTELNRN
jgi:hypothetical protein